jgi:hypothetical protein
MYHLVTRNWRDKHYGNSYVSGRLMVDYGTTYELVAVFPYQYGTTNDLYDMVRELTGERAIVHPQDVRQSEAKSHGKPSVTELITLTPVTSRFRVWIDESHLKEESAN